MLVEGLKQRRSVAVDISVQQGLQFAITSDQPVDSLGQLTSVGIEVLPQDRGDAVRHKVGVLLEGLLHGLDQALPFFMDRPSVNDSGCLTDREDADFES